MEKLDSDFLEKIILKSMITNKDFLVLISRVFESHFFDDPNIRQIFDFSKKYVSDYNQVPSKEIIINSSNSREDIKNILDNVESIDFDINRHYEFLLDQTNDYLKEKALKGAILDSVDNVESPERRGEIRGKIEDALSRDIKIDLGLDYFGQLKERLIRMFSVSSNKIPTGFPEFDEFINGGFTPYTLSILVAKIHAGKSNTMANFAARQIMMGYNIVLLTLEMSEDAFSQRMDGIFSCLDINRIYSSETYKRRLIQKLKEVKEKPDKGILRIKEFPTGRASVVDFKAYLRELKMRNFTPHIVYVDYVNLMKSALKSDRNMYEVVKVISEELRALSFDFKIPVVSVSQLNREGTFVNFRELDFNYVAESLGLAATADFMAILGLDEDSMVYQNEMSYKITKNRLGGRVGQIGKLYLDNRSLKMYDSSETDTWLLESDISGDDRELYVRERGEQQGSRETRRGRRR